MNYKIANTVYYSPAGTSEKICKFITSRLCSKVNEIDIYQDSRTTLYSKDCLNVFGVPVYSGRIPKSCVDYIKKLKVSGEKAIAIVIYGNRAYDDALLELAKMLKDAGFTVIASAAFIAQHSLFPNVANGRPDCEDFNNMIKFANLCQKKIESNSFQWYKIPGNYPYKGKNADPNIKKANNFLSKVGGSILKNVWHERKEPEWYL